MNTHLEQPQFLVFPKRRNSKSVFTALYVRISYKKNIHEKSMNIKCPYDNWDSETMTIKDYPVESFQLKESLDELKQKVMGAYYILVRQVSDFALQDLIDLAGGEKTPGVLSFTQCFQDLIARMEKSRGGDGNSATNIQKHKRCLDYFRLFVRAHYKTTDLSFARINRTTIDDLSEFLRSDGNCSHNTSMKYMQIIKKVYRAGMDNGWVRVNAFANFKFRIKTVERNCLTEEELNKIKAHHFEIDRLEFVKDLFIFCCFTGLAYIDVKNLKRSNLVKEGGREWIKSRRSKTGIEAAIPLLDPAKQIINKYSPNWATLDPGQLLFDVISNQKVNAYLREISKICGIDKPVTFHLARHTFATTVTLSNDIPLETVSKMLGHSRVSMTQHYSKVTDKKIVFDTQKLREKYK